MREEGKVEAQEYIALNVENWFKSYEIERKRVVANMQKPWWKKIWS